MRNVQGKDNTSERKSVREIYSGEIAVCKKEITLMDNGHYITLFTEQLTITFEVLVFLVIRFQRNFLILKTENCSR